MNNTMHWMSVVCSNAAETFGHNCCNCDSYVVYDWKIKVPRKCLIPFDICLWYHSPQYFNNSSVIVVWDLWLCSQLVQVLLILALSVINATNASLLFLSMWCSQGSVLCPLLLVMNTTPLSTLICSLSLNHHLYADDTHFLSLSTLFIF